MNLGRHHNEFVAAIRAGKWERSDAGIVFPKMHAMLEGKAEFRVNGEHDGTHHNLLTAEGLALISADTFPAALYTGLYTGNVTPTTAWTGANFAATATENTSITEGYLEATRPAMPDLSGINPAEFNIRTATSVSVYGLGLLSTSTRGDTAGSLVAAIRLTTAPRVFSNFDILDIRYTFVATPI